eukprot:m.33083 g.33083  ORF g.33083 m.33083 type:complete len:701 (+) comp8486_c0_seq2:328-2430(+)
MDTTVRSRTSSTGKAQRERCKALFEKPPKATLETEVIGNTLQRSQSNVSHGSSEMPDAMEGSKGVYRPLCKLGSGQFGTCWEVEDELHGNQLWVVKQIFVGMLGPDETSDALKEARLLASLKHPNVISLHEAFVHDRQFVCIVTELCEGGDLSGVVEAAKAGDRYIPESKIMKWLVQLLLALEYLHQRKVLHRDVKTKNVFLQKGIVKLGDFGIARVLLSSVDHAQTLAGTPYYMSPESLSGMGYNDKSDMWALGCVVYELCLRRLAFDGDNLLGLTYKICEGEMPVIPERYTKQLREIACSLLVRNPAQRPSAERLLQHPFIQNHTRELDSHLKRSQSNANVDRERILSEVPDMTGRRNRRKSSKSDNHAWDSPKLTPKERMEAKKRWQADQQANVLKKEILKRKQQHQSGNKAESGGSELSSSGEGVSDNSLISRRSDTSAARFSDISYHPLEKSDSNKSLHSKQQTEEDIQPPWIREHEEIFPNGVPSLNSTISHDSLQGSRTIVPQPDTSSVDSAPVEEARNTSAGASKNEWNQDVSALRTHIMSTLKAGEGKTLKDLAAVALKQDTQVISDPPVNRDLRNHRFRHQAEQKLGKEDFDKAYKFALKMRRKGASDREIVEGFSRLMHGDLKKTICCNDVDHLVMAELMSNTFFERKSSSAGRWRGDKIRASDKRMSSTAASVTSYNLAVASRTCTIL